MSPVSFCIIVVLINEIAKVSSQNCATFCNSQSGIIYVGGTCYWVDMNLYGTTLGTWQEYMNDCANIAAVNGYSAGLTSVTDVNEWSSISATLGNTLSIAGIFCNPNEFCQLLVLKYSRHKIHGLLQRRLVTATVQVQATSIGTIIRVFNRPQYLQDIGTRPTLIVPWEAWIA